MNYPHFPGKSGSPLSAGPDQALMADRQSYFELRNRNTVKVVVVVLLVAALGCGVYYAAKLYNPGQAAVNGPIATSTATSTVDQEPVAADKESSGSDCNVLLLPVEGSLVTVEENNFMGEQDGTQTLSGDIAANLDQVRQDDKIKGVILLVNSYGGTPVAGDEINKAVRRLGKPIVAVVRSAAASAGYLAIAGSDRIFVSEYSDVGSIGVTQSYLDETKKDAKEGLTYVPLVAGLYKDAGNPHRALTPAEKAMAQADLDKVRQIFINTVAAQRHLPVAVVTKLADGRTFLGAKAVSLGLADELGDIEWARRYLAQNMGEPAQGCMPSSD